MAICVAASVGWAPGLKAQMVPDVTGTWSCPRDEGLIRGQRISWELTLEIGWQEDRFFTGTYFWRVPEALGVSEQIGGEATLSGEVQFQGVIEWDNERFVLVDFGDTGAVLGRLANDHTMELIGFEAGEHALVAAAICVRVPEVAE
ncbi:MAG: hypothetical protein AAGH83_03010 [Pseudomonadota bacterium]